MRIFVSYARENRSIAENLVSALQAANFDTFFDTQNLPTGQEFNARIKMAVENSDLFIFLVSQESVRAGSYSLSELAFAESKWKNPAGYVLPVVFDDFPLELLPNYLRSINVLRISGNLEAEIIGWVHERAESVGGGFGLTNEDNLRKWSQLSQPPIRRTTHEKKPLYFKKRLLRGIVWLVMSLPFACMGMVYGSYSSVVISLLFALPGMLVIYNRSRDIRAFHAELNPVAAVVLDKERYRGEVVVHLQTLNKERHSLIAITRTTMSIYPGQIGWAYASHGLLFDFLSESSKT